jgi:hypothetical protein
MTPFGYWHQGATEEESDFFKASDSGDVGFATCTPLFERAALVELTDDQKIDIELGKVAMRFVDRAGDPADCDPAERICAEFHAAVSAVLNKWRPIPHRKG